MDKSSLLDSLAPLPALAAALVALSAVAISQQTNVVIFLADDAGYGDVGPYDHDNDPGTALVTNTPVIDALGSAGVVMNHFYASSPVCSPTRAALLTGRNPVRFGMTQVLKPNDPNGLPQAEETIAEMLAPAGYLSAIIGKWHLGDQPQYNPLNQGFDYYYGVPYSNNQTPFYVQRGFTTVDPDPNQDLLTQNYTVEALKFIDFANAQGQPFFLYVAYTMPHFPVHVSPAFDGITGRGLYADAIHEMDWSIGQVEQRLVELGLEDDTLIIFTSDNGACDEVELQAHTTAQPNWICGDNSPFKGFKSSFDEGGVRVPFVARHPQLIPAGSSLDDVASTVDLKATIRSYTGGSYTPDDGVSLRALWANGFDLPQREVHFYGLFGGNQWGQQELVGTRFKQWKQRFNQPGFVPGQLHDVVADPGETMPLSNPLATGTLSDLARDFDCRVLGLNAKVTSGPFANKFVGDATTTSGSLGCNTAVRATDGDSTTLWESPPGIHSLTVDAQVGIGLPIRQIELLWGNRPATNYVIEHSLDGINWKTAVTQTAGTGGLETYAVRLVRTTTPHVRLTCFEPAATGYELLEFRARTLPATKLPAFGSY